ncbi:MAG: UDP-N-acetylglucosamine pyrophosphorylase [Clostridiales bacterium]|nr:UDP-N-acetylglucosamine pyrophosphorylase [Clostridiales bacterium]
MKISTLKNALWGDLSHTLARELIEKSENAWDALGGLGDFILALGKTLPADEYIEQTDGVWVSRSANVYPTAMIMAPCIIGAGTEVRHCAFIRGSVIIGQGCVVGNSTEIKNSIIFDGVQIPHYNYVGDSILGYKSHMGAGAITSNVKSDKTPVTVRIGDERAETGVKKLGALIGDYVEVGCNSVLCPGSVIGTKTNIYPLSLVRGYVPENSILKSDGKITEKTDKK